jgi:hypothetical protein
MPMAAARIGAAEAVVPLPRIAEAIAGLVSEQARSRNQCACVATPGSAGLPESWLVEWAAD